MADPVEPKNPLTSKLNIFGMLRVASSVLALLAGSEVIQQHPRAVAAIGVISGIVTVVLRFKTIGPISW